MEIKKFDGYKIPYQNKAFDLAYCTHVIEHVEHPRTVLREIKRVSNFQVFEIPLDYSNTVDSKVQHFLSYGHINVFTPAIFKFLLRSEGFEIINEHFSHLHPEVLRYSWYKNAKLKKTLARETTINILPFLRLIKQIIYGPVRYREFGYSAYTCLTKSVGDLKVLT